MLQHPAQNQINISSGMQHAAAAFGKSHLSPGLGPAPPNDLEQTNLPTQPQTAGIENCNLSVLALAWDERRNSGRYTGVTAMEVGYNNRG